MTHSISYQVDSVNWNQAPFDWQEENGQSKSIHSPLSEKVSEFAPEQILQDKPGGSLLKAEKAVKELNGGDSESLRSLAFLNLLQPDLLQQNKESRLGRLLNALQQEDRQPLYFTQVASHLLSLKAQTLLELLNRCQALTQATFSYDLEERMLAVQFSPVNENEALDLFNESFLVDEEFELDEEAAKIEIFFESKAELQDFASFVLIRLESAALTGLNKESMADYLAYAASQHPGHLFSRILKECANEDVFFKAMNEGLLTSLPISQEEEKAIEKTWQHYIVRKPDWDKRYRSCSQQAYGRLMHHTVQFAAAGLKEKGWNFSALLHFLACRRQFIAYQLNHLKPDKVGILRKKNALSVTRCLFDYKELPIRLKERLEQQPSPNLKENAAIQSTMGVKGQGYTYEETLRGQRISLSHAFLYDDLFYCPEKFKSHSLNGEIIHTSANKIALILDYIQEDLYPLALAAQTAEERLIYLGKIFWWMCQAKPWHLGDPSIAETLIRSILTLKGEKSPPWKMGLIPWVEVMFEPEAEKFAASFHLLFE